MKFYTSISCKPQFLPLLNTRLPLGFPSPALDYMEERIDLAAVLAPHPLSTFYAYCDGDSMIDACIPPNSILVIDKSVTPKNGDVVVAYIDGGYTVKYLKYDGIKCYLVPANKKKNYKITEITEDMEMTIWGVVINVVINTKNIRLCTL